MVALAQSDLFGSLVPAHRTNSQFREWYALYPRHIGPAHAEAAFSRIVHGTSKKPPTATVEELMEGVRRYVAYIEAEGKDEKYIKHPATWLNGGCWNDIYQTKPTAAQARHSSFQRAADFFRGRTG